MPICARLVELNFDVQLHFVKTPHVVRVLGSDGKLLYQHDSLTSNSMMWSGDLEAEIDKIVSAVKSSL